MDTQNDEEDCILILKTMKENETLTEGSTYDDNRNTDSTLKKVERLLNKMDSRQGVILGGNFNVITDVNLDQFGYVKNTLRLTDVYRKLNKNR